MHKKNIGFIVVLIVIAFVSFQYFVADKETQELIASGHTDWAPIMYQEGDKIVGAGPEIVTRVFGELGIKVNSNYVGPWDVVQEKAESGEIDVVVAAYKTTEREAYMDYSIPYTIDPVVIMVKKGKVFPYEKWDDLIGKKGVVMIGDSYGQTFDDIIAEKLTVTEVRTPREAFALLENEEADYFVYALYSAEDYIFKNNLSDKVEIASLYASAEYFYLTISKKSSFIDLLPKINSILKKYEEEGIIKEIIEDNKKALLER